MFKLYNNATASEDHMMSAETIRKLGQTLAARSLLRTHQAIVESVHESVRTPA